MNLYTLKTRRKRLVIDPAGNVVSSHIEETHHGVPAQLVMTWRQDFPDAFVVAEEEEPQRRQERSEQRRHQDTGQRREATPAAAARAHKRVEEMTYADAITAAVRSEA